MWYMWGEVYRENSSDDAQGYQPFTTYFWDYLIKEVININKCKYLNFSTYFWPSNLLMNKS